MTLNSDEHEVFCALINRTLMIIAMGISVSNTSKWYEQSDMLSLSIGVVKKAIQSYHSFQISPLVDEEGFKFFIMLAFSDVHSLDSAGSSSANDVAHVYWRIFSNCEAYQSTYDFMILVDFADTRSYFSNFVDAQCEKSWW
jgi:hypothetical protein